MSNNKQLLDRLKKLNSIPYKTDQEIEESERLTEELSLTITDMDLKQPLPPKLAVPFVPAPPPVPEKRRKRSILEILIEKYREKPATHDEIMQLKLNAQRAELKARIATAKNRTPNRLQKVLSNLSALNSESSKPRRSPRKKNRPTYDDSRYEGLHA